MTTPTIPLLKFNNAKFWHRMLQAVAHDINLDRFLDATHTAPQDPDQFTTYKRDQERLTMIILASLPDDITFTLTDEQLKLPPYLLTQHVLNTVNKHTALDHNLLEAKARNIHLTSLHTAEEYIQKHKELRLSMRNVNYPNINDELTTVNFMIHGIQDIEDLFPTHDMMIQSPPPTISEFSTRLHRVINSIQARKQRVTNPAPHHYKHAHLLHRRRLPGASTIKQTTPHWRHNRTTKLEPTRPWCNYHNSASHSNNECRAQRFNRKTTYNAHMLSAFPPHDTLTTAIHPATALNAATQHTNHDHDVTESERKFYILDSGAHPTHLTHPHPHTKPLTHTRYTRTAANRRHPVTHSGPIQIHTPEMKLDINDAIVTPDLRHNLVSVHSLARSHGPLTFTPSTAYISTNGGHKTHKIASFVNGLYVINNKTPAPPSHYHAYHNTTSASSQTPRTRPKTTPTTSMSTRSRTKQQARTNHNSHSTRPPLPDTPSQNTRSKTKPRDWDRPWRTSHTPKTTTPHRQIKSPTAPQKLTQDDKNCLSHKFQTRHNYTNTADSAKGTTGTAATPGHPIQPTGILSQYDNHIPTPDSDREVS